MSIVDKWESTKEEFSSRELMEMERELLGIYLREHPAQKILKKAKNEWTTNIADLDEKKGQKATVAAIIKTARTVVTKTKQQEMAFLLLADEGGEIEAVVFPKTYIEVKSVLIPNSVVMIKAKVEEREDRLSLIVDSITPVNEQPDNKSDGYTDLRINENTIIIPQGTSKATLFELNKLLQENRGEDQVTLIFQNGHSNRELKLPFGINLTDNLKSKISTLLHLE